MRASRITVLAATAAALLSTSALANKQFLDPLPGSSTHVGPYHAPYVAPPAIHSGTWTGLTSAFPGSGFPDTALLLTDGTVLMHDGCTVNWFKLTPDNTGSYVNGTWSSVASMQSGYAPLYFASAVLADGRVIVEGGEYNCNPGCVGNWGTQGSIYDPKANTWTAVSPPSGWATIGDAAGIVL